jgi:hypothetical protein
MAELRRLLGEISGGWTELVASIQELKEALQPEDLRSTLEALGLDESLIASNLGTENPTARRADGEGPQDAVATASHQAEPGEAGLTLESDEAQERLETLLKLVREKLSSIESATGGSTDGGGREVPERSNDAT